jgi:hypothetical protein
MPDPTLQATALRYAAGDLTPEEVTAFEARLAGDQDARDALSEAVRLSAQAIGQTPPTPHPSFRALTRARLALGLSRGRQMACAVLGAIAVAAGTLVAASLADPREPDATNGPPMNAAVAPTPAPAPPVPPPPGDSDDDDRSVAEIWADLSNADGVEKAHDDELRWRQRVRELTNPQHVSASVKAPPANDVREP